MLISPPFLPIRNANQQDEDWVNSAMPGGLPGDGAYPVSHNLGWHGGMHITAPTDGDEALPVRAIADGTVVYVRQPTAPSSDPTHPLNYAGGWTSDGVVVVRHETSIGEGANAQVTFFSIYIHLSDIDPAIVANQPVYRKYPIGHAGQIYGSQQRKIHFEIICDDANLPRLVGRSAGNLDLGNNGRVDAVYGEMYVRLPSGTQVYAAQPDDDSLARPPDDVAPAYTTIEDLFIGLSYGGGNLTVTTYRADGSVVDTALVEADAEYQIYTRTSDLSGAYPQGRRPVRSAVYELLRFGRVIHTDETLNPADMPHWRQIAYPGGQGFANLNAAGTTKYSDADFPHWRGWSIVDDSADQDSRCDSPTIRGWLDANSDGRVEPAEATGRLGDATVIPRLERAICKFLTEWEAATIQARWRWLMQATVENPGPLSATDFEDLRRHIDALCFWQNANLQSGGAALPASHWRFHPRQFVKWFRRCGWLSQDELARCAPRTSLAGNLPWAAARQRAGNHLGSVNRFFQKYLGEDRQRHVHALAQIYIETGLLQTVTELGLGARRPYDAFYGRGLMQLTWADNYEKYGAYKGIQDQTGNPGYEDTRITASSTHLWESGGQRRVWAPRYDPNIVGTRSEHSGESGGFFWVSKTFRRTSNINRVCDLGLEGNHIGFISWLVNGGGNGYQERQAYARFVRNVLFDEVPLTGMETWNYPSLGRNLTGTFPPGTPQNNQSVQVNHARQSP
ncbi:hydroxyethylthiazole kinase [Sorangium sp. So ce118]